MDTKKRIIEFIKFKKLKTSEFEKLCSLSNGYISSMRKGFGKDKLNNVLNKFPELDRDWLLYGTGSMLKNESHDNHKSTNDSQIAKLDEEYKLYSTYKIPMSSMAGSLTNFVENISARANYERIIVPIRGVDVAMQITDNSMSPEFPYGSTVLLMKVDRDAHIRWGKAYVLDTKNGSFISNIFNSEDEKHIRCTFQNTNYNEFEISKEDILCIFNIVMLISPK